MWCTISRWMISRAEDTGKRIPRFIEKHIARCDACGVFARSAASLTSRLREERSAWLAKVPDFPVDLGRDLETTTQSARTVEAGRPGSRRLLFGLRPLPVAATALVVVAAALVLSQVLREPSLSPQDRSSARAAIKSLTSAPEGFQGAVGKAESSLEKEGRILRQSLSSAVEYLQARMNIKIERKETPKPL